ncbi:MAG: hypothetical protein AUJ74_06650 [Candidatus Omnitrophica bacterium CG1_02_44_16]|nr:MAG: hypothetical protein AUJ74_06650 [Candidatus Omnitrophica bacterium CG1_02_44_16]PIY83794.1 MAG: hypothetical protein COY78_01110 [Candidatus Omnitrophica bacterium CG_4_10_14_0_8_um_filter_44_12]
MEYRIDKNRLLGTFSAWDGYFKRKARLIACGGTAMTLLGVKESTKDIDLLVPQEAEYEYLIKVIKDLGYKPVTASGWAKDGGFIFDLFKGKKIHTTNLLESPLKEGNHLLVKEFKSIYLGVLNFYDLIISKLFRGSSVDVEDCLLLVKAKRQDIDLDVLAKRFHETTSYDVSQDRVNKNFTHFVQFLKQQGLYDEK